MKTIIVILALFFIINISPFSKSQKPYILAVESSKSINELAKALKTIL